MNTKTKLGMLICGLVYISIPNLQAEEKCACCCVPPLAAPASGTLTEAESRDLLLMREEEKLARDVYLSMQALYNQRVFINIPRAEQSHMDAMLGLLNAYGVEDPVLEDSGSFRNQELQKLYDELVARGKTTAQEAFMVGALIEEVDIMDLMEAMKRTERADIQSVYAALLGGSHRHLNAFVRNYEAQSGETYKAQRMPQHEVDTILGR